jgi:predicted metal-dependent phosphoesterase TrpH
MKIARVIGLIAWVCASFLSAGCLEIAETPPEGEWYKGDLHCHSLHSDGDSSVQDVIASAESKGLDFFVITDHDGNMDGSPTQWYDPDYHSDQMVMLYGVEWTTGRGHANVWATGPFDYEELWIANRTQDAQTAIDAAHAENALFAINHPSALLCCPWEYEEYQGIDSIEIWNAMFLLPNFNYISTKEFWDNHLLSGRRIPGIGGSDTHQLKGFESHFLRLAEPTTWVYAEERSGEAILEAIRAGRVSLSDEPRAPRIDFTADTDEDGIFETIMGDNVVLQEQADVTLRIRIVSQNALEESGTAVDLTSELSASKEAGEALTDDRLVSAFLTNGEYLVVLRRNGDLHGLWRAMAEPAGIELTERIEPSDRVFYRVELLGWPTADILESLLKGFTRALSNPIYFDY